MKKVKKALSKLELILTEFAGFDKLVTEETRFNLLQVCNEAWVEVQKLEQAGIESEKMAFKISGTAAWNPIT